MNKQLNHPGNTTACQQTGPISVRRDGIERALDEIGRVTELLEGRLETICLPTKLLPGNQNNPPAEQSESVPMAEHLRVLQLKGEANLSRLARLLESISL